MKKTKAKVLLLDIETAPILANVWGIWEQNIPTAMIIKDWHALSWSAKWLGEKEIFYHDSRKEKDVANDKPILKTVWKLLDEADIIITHNGKRFDEPRLNTRFLKNKLGKPSSYKHIDTLQIARRHFDFISNKLADLAEFLDLDVKKSKHKKFPGFKLWEGCLAGNKEAWKEMEKYNKQDVVVLEEVYKALNPWSNTMPNFSLYTDENKQVCRCGSDNLKKNGFAYTSSGKYQRYKCGDCNAEFRDATNLFSKSKRKSLKRNVT